MKDKSKKSTYSTTFGVDPIFCGNKKPAMSLLSRVAKFAKSAKFVNKNKQIYLFIFTEVYEGMRRNPA